MQQSMRHLILFDHDTRHYRRPIYRAFRDEFRKLGYELVVVYDTGKLTIGNDDLFVGIRYSLRNFIRVIRKYNCNMIIQFVWLKYLFLFPFMIYCRLTGIKVIVWSHGIGMKSLDNPLVRNLHYLRHKLATALIIYSDNERKYVRSNHKKLFVANNTLHFNSFPVIEKTREDLKEKYGFKNRKIILSVGRFNALQRKVKHLILAFNEMPLENVRLILIGPGVSEEEMLLIKQNANIVYRGEIYDPLIVNENYKMADIFVMPGGIGLGINHAFYYGLPVIVENSPVHSPEITYLENGRNGFIYEKNNIADLKEKMMTLLSDENLYLQFSEHARNTILTRGSFERMVGGFMEAIKYTEQC